VKHKEYNWRLEEALRVLSSNVSLPRRTKSMTEGYWNNTGKILEKFKEATYCLKLALGHKF